MGDKSARKKQHIIDCARGLFQEKGYNAVTMKDIVDACGISRGGLYLYYDNTGDVFLDCLKQEDREDDGAEGIDAESSVSDILTLFFREQKRDILKKQGSLTVAAYEYFFQHEVPAKDNYLCSQFESGVIILERLLTSGVAMGEFTCEDPKGLAGNIMNVLEGLKVRARVSHISEKCVDDELLFVMKQIF